MLKGAVKLLILSLVVMIVGVIAFALYYPSTVSKEQIVNLLNERVFLHNDQRLIVEGNASFSVLPDVSAELEQFRLVKADQPEEVILAGNALSLSQNLWHFMTGNLGLEVLADMKQGKLNALLETSQLNALRTGEPAEVSLTIRGDVNVLLEGMLQLTPESIVLSDATFKVDDNTDGVIDLTVNLLANKPDINAELHFAQLSDKGLMAVAAPFAAPVHQQASAPRPQQGIWRTEPLGFDVLNTVNLTLTLSAKELTYNDLILSDVTASAIIKGGRLDFNVKQVKFYDGMFSTQLQVDASQSPPTLTQRKEVRNFALGRYLADSGLYDKFEGNISMNSRLSSRGNSEAEIIRNLSGTADIVLNDGLVRGFDIVALADAAKTGTSLDTMLQRQPSDAGTRIQSLSASFNVREGIVHNQDLLIQMPVTNFDGNGILNLNTLHVDYRLVPTKEISKLDLRVPILIQGDARNPTVFPDLASVLQQGLTKEGGIEEIKKSIDRLKDENPVDAFKGLLGR